MASKSSNSELLTDYYSNALLLLVFKDMLEELLNQPTEMEDSLGSVPVSTEPSASSVPSYLQG